jgi:hypothetical protein
MVCTTTVSSRGVSPVDGSARGEDFYLAIRGDLYLATRGDMNLATCGDFFMATDSITYTPGQLQGSSQAQACIQRLLIFGPHVGSTRLYCFDPRSLRG